MTLRRAVASAIATVIGAIVAASPASAHGIGGASDLPLPAWQLAWASGFAVASSFVVLGAFWLTPRLVDAAQGVALPSSVQTVRGGLTVVLRALALFIHLFVLWAAWAGTSNGFVNITPIALFVVFWVGGQFSSILLGDYWASINPMTTLGDLAAGVRTRLTGHRFGDVDGASSCWPAVLAIASFLWLELAYHATESPRSLGLYLSIYTAAMVVGAFIEGPGWTRRADGFGLLFGLLGALSPLFRDDENKLRFRPPLAGVSVVGTRPGQLPFILTVLGATSFDGFTRSNTWLEIIATRPGWDGTIVATVGMLFFIAAVALAYFGAIRIMARLTDDSAVDLADLFAPSLIPIVAAYTVAHYFGLFVSPVGGQRAIIAISDPLGRGWDLFGTLAYNPDPSLISPSLVAWTQALAIAVGHVLGVTAAHDRAIEHYDQQAAVRSQYPMLAVMIGYTVTGLFLLQGG